MQSRYKFALLGVLLGLGAPVGSLLLRIVWAEPANFWVILAREWQYGVYYYVYMTVGTTTAFGLFGYALGKRSESLSTLAVRDGLTGLFNHRYLQEKLSSELERSDRYAEPLACLMIDIDDFKKLNDHYGHPLGDDVLRRIARILEESVRKTDRVGRYGGEEFLVVMPHTQVSEAQILAERIVQTVRERPFLYDGQVIHVTLSIGLAVYPDLEAGVKTKSALLSAADQALYTAKRAGKDRAVQWKP